MRQRTTLILLAGIFTLFFGGRLCAQVVEKGKPAVKTVVQDTINPLTIPVDSLEVLGNLTYRNYNSLPDSLPNLHGWFERMRTFTFAPGPN